MISLHSSSTRFWFQVGALSALVAILSVTGCDKLCGSNCETTSSVAVTPVTLHLDIQGMHCDGCVQAITADVREIDGVTDVQVSLEAHAAQVTLSQQGAAAKVESSIRALGYTVTVVPAQNESHNRLAE